MPYIGRFAPSPTGSLHAGSLVAALASWLDARAHGGQWLVRIEDVDHTRCRTGMGALILQQLQQCGLAPDAPVVWQSQRSAAYQQTLDRLVAQQLAYPCVCTRQDIARIHQQHGLERTRHHAWVYPGTCRHTIPTPEHPRAQHPAWRLRTDLNPHLPTGNTVIWHDRALGAQTQNVTDDVGDFVLKRADGVWAYQLAVVVDDAWQHITHVVRGADLADNTARQILLQKYLECPTPQYLHVPLVLGADGEKLSKQHQAPALDLSTPEATRHTLQQAAHFLNLPLLADDDTQRPLGEHLQYWVQAWAQVWKKDTDKN